MIKPGLASEVINTRLIRQVDGFDIRLVSNCQSPVKQWPDDQGFNARKHHLEQMRKNILIQFVTDEDALFTGAQS